MLITNILISKKKHGRVNVYMVYGHFKFQSNDNIRYNIYRLHIYKNILSGADTN